jgi:hypothetical protein
MTSNSPAECACAALLAVAFAATAAPAEAESPLPARGRTEAFAAVRSAQTVRAPRRVEIVGARLLLGEGLTDRTALILGRRSGAERIVAVDVAEPFLDLDRTASPVVLIEGEPIDSYVSPDEPSRIYGLLRERVATPATVQVGWLGDLHRTISPAVILAPR